MSTKSFVWEASMLGHGAGIGYTGLGPRMGPTDNFSLVTGSKPNRTSKTAKIIL